MRLNLLTASFLAVSVSTFGTAAFGAREISTARQESFRLSIDLGTPRRYATRYLADRRTLQIRVAQAQAKDFEQAAHYDTRYVQRVVVEENVGEVVLSIQLKNGPIAWTVFSQEQPWRLVVDIWRTEPAIGRSLEEEWAWQEDVFPAKSENAAPRNAPETLTQPLQVRTDKPLSNEALAKSQARTNEKAVALPGTDAANGSVEASDKASLPENFGRIDPIKTVSSAALSNLQREAGAAVGKSNEVQALRKLGEAFYISGNTGEASGVFRQMAQNDDAGFRNTPDALWMAGESSYLNKKWDVAQDYFRSLVLNHSSSPRAWQAKLRLADIDHLSALQGNSAQQIPAGMQERYVEIASAERAPMQAKIAASLHLTASQADSNPDAAIPHQRNLDACVTSSLVPFEMRKNCSYVQTMHDMKHSDAIGADKALQAFAKVSPNDARTPQLKLLVENRSRALLEDTNKNKDWERWVAFEKKARPEQIAFTIKNPAFLRMRAQAFDGTGDSKRSAQLFALVHQEATDPAERLETAVLVAKRNLDAGHITKANEYLRKVEADENRKTAGLSQPGLDAIRRMANVPTSNKTSMRILADEIASGRFVERDLSALLHYANMTRGSAKYDKVFEQIIAFPAKTPDEITRMEKALFRYAGDLSAAGKADASGEVYNSVAALAQGNKKSEASYRAGLAFAKAGKLEKAKGAWLSAASDGSDKRYSSLATERLERIK